MNSYNFRNSQGINYKRISKRTARTAYNSGKSIYFIACNLRPFGFYDMGIETNSDRTEMDFDGFVNSYEFYNCMNSETGKYCAYYIAEQ